MKSYKIRNAQGLFSTGGSTPEFTKRGKTWNCIGHVRAHLTLLKECASGMYDRSRKYKSDPYAGCEIIEYVCVEGPIKKIKNLEIV